MNRFDTRQLPFLTYQDAEEMIMTALPMYQRNGQAAMAKQDLSKIKKLLSYLGDPHLDFAAVHIAGTNGKGSVSHMLSAVFQSNGYQTGLFTSPHLKSYRERIRIDGAMIEEEFVLKWVNTHGEYLIQNEFSFFEMSMGLAASYFSEKNIDIAVFETGLGGRLDATNVLKPSFTIITHIGPDHQAYLGNTLPEIAREKAGIIKESVPVLLGSNMDPELYPVFDEVSEARHAPVIRARADRWIPSGTRDDKTIFAWEGGSTSNGESLLLPSLAPYQFYNINTVWYACEELRNRKILALEREKIIHGLEHFTRMTGFKGRYEIIHKDPMVILDTTHNVSGLEFYTPLFENKSVHLHLILALMKERDVSEFLSRLPKNATYYFCQPDVPRALPAAELKREAEKLGMKGEVWAHPKEALKRLIVEANEEDIGLILGSIFLVAEIL